MKILFIGPLPEPLTGHSLACKVFLDRLLLEHIVDVVDLSRRSNNNFARIFEAFEIAWHVWKKRNSVHIIYFTISESILGNIKDLLIYLVCLSRLNRMIVHLHGGAGMKTIMDGRIGILKSANRFFLNRVGAIIVLGNSLINIFDTLGNKNKLFVIPNFAEDYIFANQATILRKFASNTPLKLLFLSNMLPGKGFVELIRAYSALGDDSKNSIQIDFAGKFPSEQNEIEFADAINGLKNVHYHGSVRGEKKRQLFHGAHVFCLPTYYPYEGQPISIIEAYAAGCAVITTNHSGIGDIFTDRVNGYVVEKRSVDSILSVLKILNMKKTELARIGFDNAEIANRSYKVEMFNARLMDVVTKIASEAID